MKHSRGFVYIMVHVLSTVLIVNCKVENYFENTVDTEEIDPHSFYYDKHTKALIKETDLQMKEKSEEDYTELQTEVKVPKQEENSSSHERIFYKRLINLLLSNINVKTQNDVSLIGVLEIEVSHSQMEILQNFHVQKTSLREIDAILSNIIKKPEYNYMAGFTRVIDILLEKFSMALKIIQEYPDGVIIIFTMLMVCSMFRMVRWGQRFPIFVIIQIIFILSFFMTWWQLIKDAEIKYAAEQVKFDKIPISCEPDKMNMWDKFVTFVFSGEDCEKYYQATMSNPKLKITPAFALSHFITTVILHPVTHMGTVVSVFINNATDELPWTYAWIIRCILFLCVGLVIIMLPFCLCGASINFGLGPLFRFGIDCHRKDRKGNSIDNISKREPVQIILQVPPGTSVPAIKDTSKEKQSKAIKASRKNHSEEQDSTEDSDSEFLAPDMSCGDTAANIKSISSDENSKKCEKLNAIKTGKIDGSGDS